MSGSLGLSPMNLYKPHTWLCWVSRWWLLGTAFGVRVGTLENLCLFPWNCISRGLVLSLHGSSKTLFSSSLPLWKRTWIPLTPRGALTSNTFYRSFYSTILQAHGVLFPVLWSVLDSSSVWGWWQAGRQEDEFPIQKSKLSVLQWPREQSP